MLYTHAVATIVAGAIAFGGAWQVQNWRYGAKEAARLSAMVESEKNRDRASYEAANKFEKGRTHVETKFVAITETVEKIVDRPVYRQQCFDDDGVRALRDATAETAATSTGGTVPAAR